MWNKFKRWWSNFWSLPMCDICHQNKIDPLFGCCEQCFKDEYENS